MKNFSYFLFENFDADLESENPDNPRRVINTQADAILSRVSGFPPFSTSVAQLCDEFGTEAVTKLITSRVFARMMGILLTIPLFF